MADAAFRKAVELLARRSHFEREMRRKLTTRGFDEADHQNIPLCCMTMTPAVVRQYLYDC